MGVVDLGEVKFSWQGNYNASSTYYKQDVVYHNGSSWVAITDNFSAQTPSYTNTTYWQLFAQGKDGLATTDGDLIYHNGTQLVRLGIGSNGNILGINVETGLPEWQTYGNRVDGRKCKKGGLPSPKGTHNNYRVAHFISEDNNMYALGNNDVFGCGSGSNGSHQSYFRIVARDIGHPGWAVHDSETRTIYDSGYSGSSTDYTIHGYSHCKHWKYYHYGGSLCVDTNGDLWGWGDMNAGSVYQIVGFGNGNTHDLYGPYKATGNSYNSIHNKTITAIADVKGRENYRSAMVLDSDGTIHAIGYNGYGQLGQGNTTNQSNWVQVSPSYLADVTAICGGGERYTFFLMLKDDGNVFHLGYSGDNQNGGGNTTQSTTPYRIPYFYNNSITITKIFGHRMNCFAIDSNGDLYAWGGYSGGAPGWGTRANQTTPTKVLDHANTTSGTLGYTNGRKVWAITTTPYTAQCVYALMSDGTLFGAGSNRYGQLPVTGGGLSTGTGYGTYQNSFVEVMQGFPSGTKIQKVVASGDYDGSNACVWALALTTTGEVYSAGYNGNGQRGIGNTTSGDSSPASTWIKCPIYKEIDDIACHGHGSEGVSYARATDGTLFMTGYGNMRPSDDQHNIDTFQPVPYV